MYDCTVALALRPAWWGQTDGWGGFGRKEGRKDMSKKAVSLGHDEPETYAVDSWRLHPDCTQLPSCGVAIHSNNSDRKLEVLQVESVLA